MQLRDVRVMGREEAKAQAERDRLERKARRHVEWIRAHLSLHLLLCSK